MITIIFQDGTQHTVRKNLTVADLIKQISPSLAKSAIAARVNGQLVDLSMPIQIDSHVVCITDDVTTACDQSDALKIIRHSTAHLLAYAMKDLFPGTYPTIGPVITDGFYYDFDCDKKITVEDLEKIEKRMHEIASLNEPVSYKFLSHEEALHYFLSQGEQYKAEIISGFPKNEMLKVYSHGNFVDLCRGPHVPEMGRLKIFKLMKVSGAYWRGDANNKQLQRIYGTAWLTKKDQDTFLLKQAEAEKRDHRKLGKLLDLFHWEDDSPGMTFWHPNGWTLWQIIEQYMRVKMKEGGYQEVRTPAMMDKNLWQRSGHWDHYRDNMFITASEKKTYAIKPMSCPGHVAIFNQTVRSYRDLPLRLSEFGTCHRNESSGSLHGLLRVRSLVQDDGHIFCRTDQIVSETMMFHRLAMDVYKDFDFHEVTIKLALRPQVRSGDDLIWDQAEIGLRAALAECSVLYDELPGEGAFYGPKIEYHIKDALGRSWQCGTLQLDLVLPEKLNAEYVTSDNRRQNPVMLHRAIFGSFERFIGILIEHHAGALPLWLAPIQIVICNLLEGQQQYAQHVFMQLKKHGIRVICDLRNQKIGYKIREHVLQKIPFLIIVGPQELSTQTIAVRSRGGDKTEIFDTDRFVNKFFVH